MFILAYSHCIDLSISIFHMFHVQAQLNLWNAEVINRKGAKCVYCPQFPHLPLNTVTAPPCDVCLPSEHVSCGFYVDTQEQVEFLEPSLGPSTCKYSLAALRSWFQFKALDCVYWVSHVTYRWLQSWRASWWECDGRELIRAETIILPHVTRSADNVWAMLLPSVCSEWVWSEGNQSSLWHSENVKLEGFEQNINESSWRWWKLWGHHIKSTDRWYICGSIFKYVRGEFGTRSGSFFRDVA